MNRLYPRRVVVSCGHLIRSHDHFHAVSKFHPRILQAANSARSCVAGDIGPFDRIVSTRSITPRFPFFSPVGTSGQDHPHGQRMLLRAATRHPFHRTLGSLVRLLTGRREFCVLRRIGGRLLVGHPFFITFSHVLVVQ